MTASASDGSKYRNLWKSSLELGIPLVDGQHRNLVQHLEALFLSVEQGQPEDKVRSCLMFLEKYTQEHFHTEEQFMQKHGYPGVADHLKAHAQFRSNVKKAGLLIMSDPGSEKSLQLLESMLMNWYMEHIQGMDQKYSMFFRTEELLHLIGR